MGFAQSGATKVRVVLEQFTGAWGGFCPDSEVIMEDIISQYPDYVIGISIHESDGMEFNSGISSEFDVTGYPSGMVDRKEFSGEYGEVVYRDSWEAYVEERLSRYTPAEVDLTLTYNSTTRTITGTVTAEFIDSANGDMRFVMEVIEDNVIWTGSDYDQVNFSNDSIGHPYEGAGNPIIGYKHRHVLRANLPGTYGNFGVIPTAVKAGSTYSESFTYVIPDDYNENEISVVGFLALSNPIPGKREILNADQKQLDRASSSFNEISFIGSLSISPNPASDFIQLSNLNKIGYFTICNILGSKVIDGNISNYEKINVRDLTNGLYFLKFDDGTTLKFIKE